MDPRNFIVTASFDAIDDWRDLKCLLPKSRLTALSLLCFRHYLEPFMGEDSCREPHGDCRGPKDEMRIFGRLACDVGMQLMILKSCVVRTLTMNPNNVDVLRVQLKSQSCARLWRSQAGESHFPIHEPIGPQEFKHCRSSCRQ